ncbi:DENN domain-containing protein 3 [Kryptolebias marmoratus]|uniref:DENN domain-containing protein 3 n=1 Tax=Kryptolebias marmoratus TaxID=37003 RepID=UPI0007F92046|nr:DENN domain-containing protein 3 [Kryptolebias marmoratus]XP_024863577.1 DENN domain-containing protein 3 [Kryptolebias marmoratus]XP_024863578.1 DENN domain-containing protein 3 [Kryptolebias marmoratus]
MTVDCLPPALLEACVVVGASSEKLQEAYQVINNNGSPESVQLEPGILHVLAPPFVSKTAEHEALRSCGRKRNSCLKKKREQPSSGAATTNQDVEASEESEEVTVPKDIDLSALPQLCFPGGLEVTSEEKNEQFHFLVFTDVSGNKTYGVVMQYYRPILEGTSCSQNGAGSSTFSKLFSAYSFCVISKYAYFTALKDCLSCLLTQLRTCRLSDMEEKVKEFATKLTLVPVPPPGQLHLMFTLHPLTITLPSREDKDQPLIDLDLHLPFLCFRPQQLLQVLSCLLQEQRVVLFSADWARLCLIAESLLIFLKPLSWQHPFVPVLPRDMLDFLMAPTAFLMGSHLSHFSEVAAETDDLILVNIDDGSVSSSSLDVIDVPDIPPAAADCFTHRCQSLQAHFDLDQCHSATHTDIDELREQRRAWQHKLNHDIQRIALELVVNIFRDVSIHLNYEHRVFHSEEFLNTRHPNEQLFYKKVLDTQIFHSFLRDRLNKKMDNFARMELSTRSDMQKMKSLVEMPHRPNMQEIQAKRKSSISENRMNKRLGMSLPNLAGDRALSFKRNPLFSGIIVSDSALKSPPKPVKVLKLPLFPVTLSFSSVQSFFIELIQQLGKAIDSIQNENSSLLARFYYLRGLINTLCLRRLDALSDFQNLCKTDTAIFPTHVVTWLVDSLQQDERQQVHKRPELKRLIFKVKTDNEKPLVQTNNCIKRFKLPQNHLDQDEFVRCVQECGIVKDVATILRLFDALAGDHSKQVVEPEVFRLFYTFWKETEAGVQDVNHLSEVVTQLDNSECVYKLSSCVKTSHGVGKIAMTQKRLFLLTEGKPGFLEITKFRDIKDVKIASTPFLLGRVPSLRVLSSSRSEVFEANLRTETKLWSLVVREMWAGRKMADEHKDPEYITRALTNVLLMDAVVGCLQTQRSISAASKLAHFDKIKHEAPMMVPETTSETLKHKINPSLDLAEPQTVHVLLYTPGQLSCNNAQDEMNPKLWVALSGGRVVVFDAASWLMLQDDIQVGESQVTCMMGLVQDQVWMGSQDSVIYIIDTHSMSCNKQLTEHRHEVTGLSVDSRDHNSSQHIYSCSCDGTVLQWDLTSLTVKQQFNPTCDRLSSIQIDGSTLWCCCGDVIVELKESSAQQRRIALPSDLQSMPSSFSCFVVIPERGQLWAGCSDSVELYVWQTTNLKHPFKIISLPNSSRITCMIGVKNQIWVGCDGQNGDGGQCDGQLRSQVFVVDLDSLTVAKELLAHSDSIQTLCSAEDRYVLSGAARHDGKIAIWKVE